MDSKPLTNLLLRHSVVTYLQATFKCVLSAVCYQQFGGWNESKQNKPKKQTKEESVEKEKGIGLITQPPPQNYRFSLKIG